MADGPSRLPLSGLTDAVNEGMLGRAGRDARCNMKLVLLIVQDSDANQVVEALVDRGFPVTRLASTGGFLRMGSSLLISGVEDDRVEPMLQVVEAHTSTGIRVPIMHVSGEVQPSRAVVFVCRLERFASF